MTLRLTDEEKAILAGGKGTYGDRMAMEVVAESARYLGAKSLVPVASSHIDGCLYHGDSGTLYCEKLVDQGARVRVPTSTNVGALNLLKPDQCRLEPHRKKMAFRLMVAHEKMGCAPSWTCAPYQAGARPSLGQQIAWGESNAVAFANTVLGARTNRYGDFLDIACAISARAPDFGLHIAENRTARLVIDASDLPARLLQEDAFYPVLGALIGRLAGETIAAVTGMPDNVSEDALKALCAGAASTGAVALIHIVGVTPEATTLKAALGGLVPEVTITLTHEMILEARDALSLSQSEIINSVALGSPHFNTTECKSVLRLAAGRGFEIPFFICMGRHTFEELKSDDTLQDLEHLGIECVVDTCVVVTPILPRAGGVMMTNSAKFAHYVQGNTGHAPIFGTLRECVLSAQSGRVIRDPDVWS